MVSVRVQVVCSLLLWAFFFLLVNNDVVTRIWPGAVAGGLKLLCLGLAPVLLGLMGEKAVPKTARACPCSRCAPTPNVWGAGCAYRRPERALRCPPCAAVASRAARRLALRRARSAPPTRSGCGFEHASCSRR